MMANSSEKRHRAILTLRHRRWQDLRGWRLNLGLCLGPIMMALLFVLLQMIPMDTPSGEVLAGTFGILVFGIPWALIGGWIYLLAVVRTRGKIARIECLLLGVVLTDLLPLIMFGVIFAGDGWDGIADIIDTADVSYFVALMAFSEVFFSLFGLLVGWLFWRFGVRPAPQAPPVADPAAVFD